MRRKKVFVDNRIPTEAEAALSGLGFEVITLPPFSRLGEAVASHTDMLLFKVGDEVFSHADYIPEAPYVFDALHDSGVKKIHVIDEDVAKEYPKDARLNILLVGKRAFCRAASASPSVLSHLRALGYEIINVNQGYPACCALKLSENAVITADTGLARVMSKHGIEVCEIENGGIDLYPYEYGFIGGAAGICGDSVYFTGSLERHPSFKKILTAIEKARLKPVFLTRTRPVDVGGLLFTD